jgi:DNA-binding transcriptional ArsR family regulator
MPHALRKSAAVFAALGDETRLKLVRDLSAHGPQSITRIATGSTITRQAITKHLHVLAGAGLVRGVRRGRERIWQFESARLKEAQKHLDQISRQWDDALTRLKAHVQG